MRTSSNYSLLEKFTLVENQAPGAGGNYITAIFHSDYPRMLILVHDEPEGIDETIAVHTDVLTNPDGDSYHYSFEVVALIDEQATAAEIDQTLDNAKMWYESIKD